MLDPAVRAPRGPEVDDHDLASQARQRHGPAPVQRSKGEAGRRLVHQDRLHDVGVLPETEPEEGGQRGHDRGNRQNGRPPSEPGPRPRAGPARGMALAGARPLPHALAHLPHPHERSVVERRRRATARRRRGGQTASSPPSAMTPRADPQPHDAGIEEEAEGRAPAVALERQHATSTGPSARRSGSRACRSARSPPDTGSATASAAPAGLPPRVTVTLGDQHGPLRLPQSTRSPWYRRV